MSIVEPLTIVKTPSKIKPSWEVPTPFLPAAEPSQPYPLEALPTIVKNAVTTYQNYGQQPFSLIACSALANVSLACQTMANVARDKHLVSPVSLYFLVIANSGERKSAADFTFSKATRHWQLETRKKLEPEIKVAETLYQAWQMEKEGLLTKIRRNTLSNNANATDTLRNKLLNLVENEPKIPLLPVLFFEDTTQEALASHIAHGWPSTSLWTDEGGIVMGGHGMQTNSTKFIALLNRLWDGKTFIAHRKTSESFTIADRRLTVNLMMQPLILEQMLAKNAGISRQSGFLARSLIAYPKSAMGHRYYQEPSEILPAMQTFHQRLIDCLDSSLALDKTGCHNLPTLNLSQQAKSAWITFFNEIETGLQKAALWQSIKDFASKAAENVARLAALFHLLNGSMGEILTEDVEQASEIIRWHLFESKIILGSNPQTIQLQDAQKLLQWLIEKELYEVSPRHLLQYGPLRDRKRRDSAINILLETKHFRETKQNNKTILLINPHVFEK